MRKLFLLISLCFIIGIYAQTDARQLAQQITTEMEAIDATLPQINILIKKGEKAQAREMIEKALKQIEGIEANRKRLDAETAEEVPSLAEIQETKQYLTNKLNQLRYTNLSIQCEAKLFEGEYSSFCEDIRTALSDENVSFVENTEASDWTITLTAKAREYNKADFGGKSTYFSYVDVRTVIVKTATGKRLLDKTLTEKGGSPFGFEQAAQEAYKGISPKVSQIIKEQIAQ